MAAVRTTAEHAAVRILLGLTVAAILATSCALAPEGSRRPNECVPNAPRACTTVAGVALGEFIRSMDVRPPQACPKECRDPAIVARLEVEKRLPGHAEIVAIDEFGPDWSAICGADLCTVSGTLVTFLFTFRDGTALPIVVRCPGISWCQA
jgi:hypothetical protein